MEVYPQAEQTISVGGSVLYQCRAVAGIPSPEIQWTRQGGSRLTSNAEVLSGGVLRITRVTGSEAGSYVCTATNTAGRATIVSSLIIQKPPTVRLQPSGSLQIVLGRPLRLECLVEGEPRWGKAERGNADCDLDCRPSIVWRKIGQQGPREVARGSALFEVMMMVTVVYHQVVVVILFLGEVSGTTGRRHLCLFGFQSCWGDGREGPGQLQTIKTQMRSKTTMLIF